MMAAFPRHNDECYQVETTYREKVSEIEVVLIFAVMVNL